MSKNNGIAVGLERGQTTARLRQKLRSAVAFVTNKYTSGGAVKWLESTDANVGTGMYGGHSRYQAYGSGSGFGLYSYGEHSYQGWGHGADNNLMKVQGLDFLLLVVHAVVHAGA